MADRQKNDSPAMLMLRVVCMVWGLQPVAREATAADVAPMLQSH